MTIQVIVRAPSLSADVVADFRRDVRLVFSSYSHIRRRFGIPATAVTALLADDFRGEVDRFSPSWVATPFDPTRVGGEAGAKNLDQSDDYRLVTIVFNADYWRAHGDPIYRLHELATIAHELAHPLIERVRFVSGAMDGVVFPSITPHEGARSGARILAGEYRADAIAELTLGALATVEVDGVTRPARTWLVNGQTYLAALAVAAADAYPRWPDTVERYGNGDIPIEDMWDSIVRGVDQTLTVIIHAQAMADAADAGFDVLADPTIAGLPATRLYLAEPVRPFIELLRRTPAILKPRDAKVLEAELVHVGSQVYLEMWSRLGVRPRDLPRPHVYLDVDDPVR